MATATQRFLAFAFDVLVIALWGGAVFGLVMLVTSGRPPRPANPWQAQCIGLMTMTLPVVLYFAVAESSRWRASFGKRVVGIVVSAETGEPLSFGSALIRNAIKFAPWEFGHTVAHQAVFSGERGVATWVWIPVAIAFIGPMWWIVEIIARGRAPYDRWTRSRVVGVKQADR